MKVSEVGNRVMGNKVNRCLPLRVLFLVLARLGSSSATLSPSGINYEGPFQFGLSSFPLLL